MSITGTVEEGKIVLPPGVNLPNGTLVTVQTVEQNVKQEAEPQNLYELLKDFDGIATDLPVDFAANHNHYIHGHPKK